MPPSVEAPGFMPQRMRHLAPARSVSNGDQPATQVSAMNVGIQHRSALWKPFGVPNWFRKRRRAQSSVRVVPPAEATASAPLSSLIWLRRSATSWIAWSYGIFSHLPSPLAPTRFNAWLMRAGWLTCSSALVPRQHSPPWFE